MRLTVFYNADSTLSNVLSVAFQPGRRDAGQQGHEPYAVTDQVTA
jgi:hypothetical protein